MLGLARSGVSVALALRARGEEVIGCDAGASTDPRLAESARRLLDAGVEVRLDASGVALAARARTLIKSPGVPQSAPLVAAARSRGIPVLGELEIAWRLLSSEFVAVTGTNGKTTTTEWIGHIHRAAGLPVAVAGNVGTAVSSLIDEIDSDTTVICEASSFQLEDTEAFAPEAALLLNLEPDHLDRHLSMEAYTAAKLRIFANQGPTDIAVIPPRGIDVATRASVIRYGDGLERELADEIALPGEHNRENGMAAAATCLARGIDRGAVAEGLRTFQGVMHRLERIGEVGGVVWVNDSKATNVASTIVALQAFTGGVHLIAGGRGKGQDFSPLVPLVRDRCRAVYLVGEATPELATALEPAGVELIDAGDLRGAVAAARERAWIGETVLLSPACASYDQYRDFEARGEAFRALVEGLE